MATPPSVPVTASRLWLLLALFGALFVLNFAVTLPLSPTSRIWLVLSLFSLLTSIFLLVRCGLPRRDQQVSALLLGLLVVLSGLSEGKFFSLPQVIGFVLTSLGMLACFSVFNGCPAPGRWRPPGSVAVGLLVGAVLGAVNAVLGRGSHTLDVAFTLERLLATLSPALMEEIGFRAVFFALCLYGLDGKIRTRSENLACWALMVLPHTLAHTPEQFISRGVGSGLGTTALLALLFGWPFAALQRRVSLTAAVVAHGAVDLIRFILFGLS